MEREEVIVYEAELVKHHFYCDECGEYLGVSKEYDDGWYKELGELELKFYIDHWYIVKKCLCGNCAAKFIENLKATLKNFGFEKK